MLRLGSSYKISDLFTLSVTNNTGANSGSHLFMFDMEESEFNSEMAYKGRSATKISPIKKIKIK